MSNHFRSYLFVPAASKKIMDKALNSEADSVIVDFEDAVALSEKETARERAKSLLLSRQTEKTVFIRINDITTPFWKEDLEAAITAGVSGVIVPKAENAGNMQVVCQTVLHYLNNVNRTPDSFEVLALIETARGVHFAYEIASSHYLVNRLVFGSIDYSLDVNCELTPHGTELLFARSQIVNASKAAGIDSPVDAVYPDLQNEPGLKNEAERARALGFTAKLAIHPKQIPIIHDTYTPSQQEVESALEIVKAFEEAEQQNIASISVGGKLVDYPVYKKAKAQLQFLKREGEQKVW
jgi:citrate lyase subunit beta / citryl-CoA lyase